MQSVIQLHQTDIGYIRSRSVLLVIPGHFRKFTVVIQHSFASTHVLFLKEIKMIELYCLNLGKISPSKNY